MKAVKFISILAIVALVAVLFFAGDVLTAEANPLGKSAESNMLKNESEVISTSLDIGDKAVPFTLKNIDDKNVSLRDYRDQNGVILIFTTNHCPYSVAYEDRIVALQDKFAEKGFPVVAINPNNPASYPEDSFENMKKRAKDKGFNFPYLFDDGQKIYPQYGATKTPHVYVLEKEPDAFYVRYIGAIDDNYKKPEEVEQKFVENAVMALLNGREIQVKTTKAIGCSIKR